MISYVMVLWSFSVLCPRSGAMFLCCNREAKDKNESARFGKYRAARVSSA